MNKSIMIPEGGIARGFTAERLKVPLKAGGYELLVPESAVGLGELRATVNRRYRASEDGLFAYSVVKTDVPDGRSVTGKGPDGKKYKVTVDDGGNIVETEEGSGAPTRISVTTPPTNPYGIYQDGQTVTKDGMVVTAYDANGNVWGTVPLNEITIEPTIAVYDSTTDFGTATSSLIDNIILTLIAGTLSGELVKPSAVTMYQNLPGESQTIIHRNGVYGLVCASSNPVTDATYYTYWNDDTKQPFSNTTSLTETYTYNGQTVYFRALSIGGPSNVNWATEIANIPDSISVDMVAWTMIYGTKTQMGGHQTITVSWPRPGDGTILETTFVILVAPGYTPGGEE